ncbi:MAG TPA: acyl carrier protein [Methylomirabilota bacterium]|nr:acyl carrier protein [Methylomirabilota bacterium]
METDKVLEELKDIMVERLKFDPSRLPELTVATLLPKNVEGSLGLDSLDFIEMSIAIEDRFGFVIDETQNLEAHFQSLGALVEYIRARGAER